MPPLLYDRRLQPTVGGCQPIDSFAVRHILAMKTSLRRLAMAGIAGLSLLALAVPMAADAENDSDHDHDLARDLYEQGEIRALADILHVVGQQTPGQVVAVDLVKLNNRWVYRFQIVTADGRRQFVNVDAGAATLIHNGDNDQ